MSSLDWRDAERSDHAELSEWICADPPKKIFDSSIGRSYHPEQWALDVQSEIRDLCPPVGGDDRLVLARDDRGIVGVAYFGFDRGEGEFHMRGLAVAVRARRQGIGKQGLTFALDEILAWRAELQVDGGVFARVHEDNAPSQALLGLAGFEYIGVTNQYHLQIWALDLAIEAGLIIEV
ncbi:GNAT family N-acetyltransferase [Isoptericola sp. NPDC019693]|uniref:GNAT family N-acetyltransferase n=1 Tax=Isoptericola sp. NPDC019693 TaxID=3364009 RepID=UPI0037AE2779